MPVFKHQPMNPHSSPVCEVLIILVL